MVKNLHEFEYDETRPLTYTIRPVIKADCSWACAWLAHRAGWLMDPLTGLDSWPDWGNSSSCWNTARHIAPGHVRPGDFITYGPGGDKHMVFVIARLLAGDFLCMSHGGPTGETPQYQKHSVLVGLGTPTFCRVNTAARHPLGAP